MGFKPIFLEGIFSSTTDFHDLKEQVVFTDSTSQELKMKIKIIVVLREGFQSMQKMTVKMTVLSSSDIPI